MKARDYGLAIEYHEENLSGLRCSRSVGRSVVLRRFVPTVENVKEAIRNYFPNELIDEKYDMSIKEQIADSLKFGFFSIALVCNEEFCCKSAEFYEV